MREIDALFRSFLRPPLVKAGYRRRGNRFFKTSADGDLAMLEARSSPKGSDSLGFWVKAGLFPRPWLDFQPLEGSADAAGLPTATELGLWSSMVEPDTDFEDVAARARFDDDQKTFGDATIADAGQWGERLQAQLDRRVVPFLDRMLDRPTLLEALRSGSLEPCCRPLDLIVMLVDHGRTHELAQAVATLQEDTSYRSRIHEYIAHRLPPTSADEDAQFWRDVETRRALIPFAFEASVTAFGSGADGVPFIELDRPPPPVPGASHAQLRYPDGAMTPVVMGKATRYPIRDGEGAETDRYRLPVVGVDVGALPAGCSIQIR